MVTFILGAKRDERENALLSQIKKDEIKDKIIIVPEQISLSTEQKMGNIFKDKVTVLSFKRLCEHIFKKYGTIAGDYATNKSKLIIMEMALNQLKDELLVYKKSISKHGFIKLICQTIDSMKNAGLTSEDLAKIEDKIDNSNIKQKTKEISKIYAYYDAILKSNYKDPLDDMKRAKNLARENQFFKGKSVYFDRYLSFSGSQIEMIEEVVKQADTTFCISADRSPLFETSQKTIEKIINVCMRYGVKVKSPIYNTKKPDISEQASFLEPNLYKKTGKQNNLKVQVCIAQNEYDEIDMIVSKVIELTKKGYRYKDIVILNTNLENYKEAFKSSFRRYNIPYYLDELTSCDQFSVFKCVISLLNAVNSLTTSCVLSFLKNETTNFSVRDVSIFENYIYTWNINAKNIKSEFKNNPRGFISKEDVKKEDNEVLKIAETVRKTALRAIQTIGESENNAQSIATGIIKAMEILGVQKGIDRIIQTKDEIKSGDIIRSWDLLIDVFEEIFKCTKNINISLKRYTEVFKTISEQKDVGMVPQMLDELMVGDVNSAMISEAKVVIITGANEGMFPLFKLNDKIFTGYERQQLKQEEINIYKTNEEIISENRLKAYELMSVAKDMIIFSARSGDASGKALYPSALLKNIESIYGKQVVENSKQMDILDFCHTKKSAFLNLALNYNENGKSINELKAYFERDPVYKEKLKKIEASNDDEEILIKNKNIIKKLTPNKISPTQIESFYSCPFNYFCRYTVGVKPPPTTKLNAPSLGSIIHKILEKVISNKNLFTITNTQLRRLIEMELDEYLKDNLGGKKGKSARFLQIYYNITDILIKLCENIKDELKTGEYKPTAFEVKVGAKEIPPLEIESDNEKINVVGKIDRVDTCQIDNKTYVRIIDYKSRKKRIDFGELYLGLNMQMLIYLLSVYEGAKKKGKNIIPAGILYLPATGNLREYVINTRKEIDGSEKIIKKGFRASGIILSDINNINAMEKINPGESGRFVELRMSKDGTVNKTDASKFLVSQMQMNALFKFITNQIKEMSKSIKEGKFSKAPVVDQTGKTSTCDRCDYYELCGHIPNADDKMIKSLQKEEFLKLQEEQKVTKNDRRG